MSLKENLLSEASGIVLKESALIVIDMQNAGLQIVPPVREIIPTVKGILEVWRKANLPVVFKVREHRADGIDIERFRLSLFEKRPFMIKGTSDVEIFPELKPAEGEYIVKGARFSAFFQTDLQLILTRLGVRTLFVCGIQTPNCVRATVMDALAFDYQVVLIDDAVAAQSSGVHEANVFDMKNMGVAVVESAEFTELFSGYAD